MMLMLMLLLMMTYNDVFNTNVKDMPLRLCDVRSPCGYNNKMNTLLTDIISDKKYVIIIMLR